MSNPAASDSVTTGMAKEEMFCVFSGEPCKECALYRGRHYYLCFAPGHGANAGPREMRDARLQCPAGEPWHRVLFATRAGVAMDLRGLREIREQIDLDFSPFEYAEERFLKAAGKPRAGAHGRYFFQIDVWGCKPCISLVDTEGEGSSRPVEAGVPAGLLDGAVFSSGGNLLMAGHYPIDGALREWLADCLAAGCGGGGRETRTDVAVLAALGFELGPIASALGAKMSKPVRKLKASSAGWKGLEIRLVRTGVGGAARAAARAVIEDLHPRLVLSAGTAGGLVPGLRAGTVVFASSLVSAEAGPGSEIAADAAAVSAAERAGAGIRGFQIGRFATAARPVSTPSEKARLRASSAALVCEMESRHIAEECLSAGTAFAALRAVSDTSKDALPDFSKFAGPGGIDPVRMAEYFAAKPDEARRFAALSRKSVSAARRLADFVVAFLEEYLLRG